MSRITLALSLVLVCGIAVNAQEPELISTYEHLQVLEAFLGPWISDGPAKGDFPGGIRKGTLMVVKFNYDWAWKKYALVMDWSGHIECQDPLRGKVLIGWCPNEKKFISRAFTTAGATVEGVWEVDRKTLEITNSGAEPDGKAVTSVIINRLTDDGKMVWQATKQIPDGNPNAKNLFSVTQFLQRDAGVRYEVVVVEPTTAKTRELVH